VFFDVQEAQAHFKRVAPDNIRLRLKSLWLDTWNVEFHGYYSVEMSRTNQSHSQSTLAHILHPGGEGLPNVTPKPHRQVYVVSEIPAMFTLHLGKRDIEHASQSSFLNRLAEDEVCS
jgi:hypothetical protein